MTAENPIKNIFLLAGEQYVGEQKQNDGSSRFWSLQVYLQGKVTY